MRRVGSDIRHDAAGQCQTIEPGQADGIAGKRDTRLLDRPAAPDMRTVRLDTASGCAAAPAAGRGPRARSSMTPSRTLNPREQRVVLVAQSAPRSRPAPSLCPRLRARACSAGAVTCSKNTPSEQRARRRGDALEPAVAKSRDRGRQSVAHAVDRQHRAGREAAQPTLPPPRAPRDDRRACRSARESAWRASSLPQRQAAQRATDRTGWPLRDAVLQRSRQSRERPRAALGGGAPS